MLARLLVRQSLHPQKVMIDAVSSTLREHDHFAFVKRKSGLCGDCAKRDHCSLTLQRRERGRDALMPPEHCAEFQAHMGLSNVIEVPVLNTCEELLPLSPGIGVGRAFGMSRVTKYYRFSLAGHHNACPTFTGTRNTPVKPPLGRRVSIIHFQQPPLG